MSKRPLRRNGFPALTNFVRGYLHEDFPEVHGSVQAAAAAFAADANAAERQQLVEELEFLLDDFAARPPRELHRFVTDVLGSRWEPRSRQELVELIELVRATLS